VSLFDGDGNPAAQPGSVGRPTGVADVSHETIRDQLSDFIDDSLPEPDRARVDEHLRSCRSCRAYERTLRATVRAISDLPREQAPADARRRLRAISES
jgi:anti-sigma factor RsiW